MESLRGTLVPWTARTMKNWCATPSLAPQLMPRRPAAAGRWIAGLFQQLRVLVQQSESLRECRLLCSVLCLQRNSPEAKGWPRKGKASIFKWVHLWGREKREGRSPVWAKYLLLLSFAPQLWQPISLENSVLLFPAILLWWNASGRISAQFYQELLWAFFQRSEGKKSGIIKKSCFLGEEGAAGAEVSL